VGEALDISHITPRIVAQGVLLGGEAVRARVFHFGIAGGLRFTPRPSGRENREIFLGHSNQSTERFYFPLSSRPSSRKGGRRKGKSFNSYYKTISI
jgi:hypothetical protein